MAELAVARTGTPMAGHPARWDPRGAWDGVARPGRHGLSGGPAGVAATRLDHRQIATVTASPQGVAAAVARAECNLGRPLPPPGRASQGDDLTFVWSGPGQWLALCESANLACRLRDVFGETAGIADQTGGRAVLTLAGPHVRDTLAKGVMIDLHPGAFRAGDALTTSIAHVGAQLWLGDDGETWYVAVPTSFAGSFWSWLSASAAEYGLALT